MVGIFVVVSTSLALLIVGILYAKPIQDAWQSSQSERMIAEARDMMENGQSVNAYLKAQEAYTKAPHSVEAMRFNADIFTKYRPETALYFGDLIKQKGAETLEDKMRRVRALKNLNRDKEATTELEKLLREEQTSVPLMVLAEEMWGQRQQNGALLSMMKIFCQKNPEDMNPGCVSPKCRFHPTSPPKSPVALRPLGNLPCGMTPLASRRSSFSTACQRSPRNMRLPTFSGSKLTPKAMTVTTSQS